MPHATSALITTALLLGSAAIQASDCGTSTINTGAYRIYAWKNGSFAGSACRSWGGDLSWLQVDFSQTAGGYDAGAGRAVSAKLVSSVPTSYNVDSSITISLSGSGHWWYGPKCIISKTSSYQGLTSNYECYVIEKAEKSAADYASWLGATYRSQATYNGSTYKMYTRTFNGIYQVYAIRQSYRTSGALAVGYVVKHWKDNGLVPSNYYCLGFKSNLETSQATSGYVKWTYFNYPSW